MTDTVFLVEVDAYHVATGHLHRFYFSTGPYQCRRTDTLADLAYAPVVEQAADVALTLSSYGDVATASAVQIGQTVLANRLDWQRRIPIRGRDLTAGGWVTLPAGARPLSALWTDYVLAGKRIAVYVGPSTGARDSDFTALCSVGQELPKLADGGGIVLAPRDRALDFDTAMLTATYGGAGGLDGTADMKGRTKERCFGWVLSLEPTYLGVVGGYHTYSVNGGRMIEGVVRVRDGYVDLTETTGAPAAGQWRQDKSNGTFQLGGGAGTDPVAFGLTCEVKGDKSGGVWRVTAGDLIRWWATGHSGVLADPAGVDVAAIAALNTAAPYTLGLWLPSGDGTTVRSAMDQAAQSVLGFWLVTEADQVTVGRVLPASGAPVRQLLRGVDHMGLVPVERDGREMPAKAALVRVGRNYAPGDAATLDRNVTGDARAIGTTEWRECRTVDDAGVVAAYGATIARVVERDTLLRFAADGDAVAALLLADAKVPRLTYRLQCTRLFADLRRLGVVSVVDTLPGAEAGKLLRIIGVGVNQRAKLSTFTLRE